MKLASVDSEGVAIDCALEDLRFIEAILKAGTMTDPLILGTSKQDAAQLHAKINSLLGQADNKALQLSISNSELRKLCLIAAAVNALDPELYFQELQHRFPDEKALNDFVDKLWSIQTAAKEA